MATHLVGHGDMTLRDGRTGRREFRWLFWGSFPIFLAIALLGRLGPTSQDRAHRGSVIEEARTTASAVIPYVFMG